jgi:hypothetical protein
MECHSLEESHLTVCVTCVWAGVDKAWEQKKPEARKMLINRADSHTSGARFVRWRFGKVTYILWDAPFLNAIFAYCNQVTSVLDKTTKMMTGLYFFQ